MFKALIRWSFCFLAAPVWAQGQSYTPPKSFTMVVKETTNYYVGERQIRVVASEKEGRKILFLNVHDNENTSVQAVEVLLRDVGGKLIQLQHTGDRNISFGLDGKPYVVDPNRIFTDLGIQKTLQTNSQYAEAAADQVRQFTTALINDYGLSRSDMIVALHNNTDHQYSVKNYMRGGDMANDAAKVRYVSGSDEDDFFFVTNPVFYDKLVQAGFNVVLQNNATVTDDGSFSVYCGYKGIPYINVEAEHGHVERQVAMIRAVLLLF